MSTTKVIRSNTLATPAPDYTTIGAFGVAAAAASWSGGWIGECYNDSQFNEDVSMTAVSSSDYGILRAAAGQSAFDNTANPLTYDVSKGVGIHAFASTFVITVGSYTTIERLQFNSNNAFGLTASIYNSTANFANKCLFYKSDTGTCGRVGGGATVTNCVFISEISIGVGMAYAASTVFVNNTVVAPSDKSNSSAGIQADYTPKIINCAIFGFSGGAVTLSRGTPTGSNNATDYATLPFGTGNQTGLTYANQFNGVTTTGGLDYRLKTGTSIGASAGIDETLYIPANDDIFSTARSTGQWSIGAFQPTGGGGTNVNLVAAAATGAAGSFGPSALLALSAATANGAAAAFKPNPSKTLGAATSSGAAAAFGISASDAFAAAIATGAGAPFAASLSKTLAAAAASGAVGSFGATPSPPLVAAIAHGAAGAFTSSIAFALAAAIATGAAAPFSVQTGSSTSINLIAASATGGVGSFVPKIDKTLTAVAAIGAAAGFGPLASPALAAVAAVGAAGGFVPSPSGLLVPATCVGAAGAFGKAISVSLSGVAATGVAVPFVLGKFVGLSGVAAICVAENLTVVITGSSLPIQCARTTIEDPLVWVYAVLGPDLVLVKINLFDGCC